MNINTLFWSKYKRTILIVLAIVILVALFLTKNKTIFRSGENALEFSDGLVYDNTVLGDLISMDTDSDGILDWEESLWGTDPTKADTDGDGVLDNNEIAKLKSETNVAGNTSLAPEETENLTETEKFAQELFTTAAALNQAGALDEATIDAMGTSLLESIFNVPQKKTFTVSDIKTTPSDSKEAVKKYADQLATTQTTRPLGGPEDVAFALLESITPEGETNVAALNKLDPIIGQFNDIIKDLSATDTPLYLAPMHLLVINGFQKLSENLTDIKLMDADPVVAFGAINKYEENLEELTAYLKQLYMLVSLKLSS